MSEVNKKSGLATAGLVLGIIGVVLAFIPVINIAAFVLGVLALVFGVIPLVSKRSVGKAIASVALGVTSIFITVAMLQAFSEAMDEATSPSETSSTTADTSQPAQDDARTSFDGNAAFDRIENGMSKQQVRDITGIDSESCSESSDPTFGTIESCTYGNLFRDDVTLSVSFSNGSVSNKSRFSS